jgi:hypothetical protein
MFSFRLLAAFFLLASASAFTQSPTAITPLGAWDMPSQNAEPATQVPIALITNDENNSKLDSRVARLMASIPWDPDSQTLLVNVSPEGKIAARVDDSVCYAIRGYRVARDSKDSDAVHPAGYTTCQPGRRFGLKTTDLRSNSRPERQTNP